MDVLSSYHPLASAVAPQQQPYGTQGPSEAIVSERPVSSRTDQALTVDAFAAPEVEQAGLSVDAASLKYRRSERTSLYIKTQEGDVVRLKFRTREAVSLETAHAEGEHGEVSELSLKTRSASKLSVSVKGDLSAAELAAIQDTIEQATELAEDFFAGDVAAAFEGASALEIDGGQLARVKLKMKTMEHITYSARAVSLGMPTQVGAPQVDSNVVADDGHHRESDSGVRIESEPRVVLSEGATEAADAPDDATSPEGDLMPAAPDEGESPVEGPPSLSSSAEVFRSIGSFLTKLMDAFGAQQGGGSASVLDVSLKLRVFESTLVTLSQMRMDSEAPVSPLLHETIDALEAQEQPPMDQVA
jgi:methionine-rich copper-binding protein CopC